MDMNYPRSYHSMIFNDVFETIMVIGGEYCNTVEIFDPLTNRWQLLPHLMYLGAIHFSFLMSQEVTCMYYLVSKEIILIVII